MALTPMEIEMIKLVAKGLQNKEIAYIRNITVNSAKVIVSNIIRKLGFHNRTQLALWYAMGLCPSEITDDIGPHRDSRVQ